jgi:hypothetical protein
MCVCVCVCDVCVARWSAVNITLADTTCKLPDEGVLPPKHVGVILILILN